MPKIATRQGLLPCISAGTASITPGSIAGDTTTNIGTISDNDVRIGDLILGTLNSNADASGAGPGGSARTVLARLSCTVNGQISVFLRNTHDTQAAAGGLVTLSYVVLRG